MCRGGEFESRASGNSVKSSGLPISNEPDDTRKKFLSVCLFFQIDERGSIFLLLLSIFSVKCMSCGAFKVDCIANSKSCVRAPLLLRDNGGGNLEGRRIQALRSDIHCSQQTQSCKRPLGLLSDSPLSRDISKSW